jgi:hypothetical protein
MNKSLYDSSITNMYKIYTTHPKSQFASKALYAIGWMLENKNLKDSAAVVYDTLVKVYPHSVYAADVLPKLNFYKTELVRLKKVLQDSLYALAHPGSGALKADSLQIKKQKSALASDMNAGNNPLGSNLKESAAPNKAKEETKFINNDAIANPDTLIRNKGRGLRRIIR